MITEKTKYYLTINGMRWLNNFRESSKRKFDAYNCCTQLHYQVANTLAGNQRGLTRSELYNRIALFPDDAIKNALMKMRKAGYISVSSGAGVRPKRRK